MAEGGIVLGRVLDGGGRRLIGHRAGFTGTRRRPGRVFVCVCVFGGGDVGLLAPNDNDDVRQHYTINKHGAVRNDGEIARMHSV